MKIGIVGAGNVGTAFGKRLAARGHDIIISFARAPEIVNKAAKTIDRAIAATSEEAVALGGVVIVALPWAITLGVVQKLAEPLAGKIVWDTTNPLAPDMSELLIGTTTSAGEQMAAAVPHARVVKAVPPFAELMHSSNMLINGQKPGLYVCSDDAEARRTIADLAISIDIDAVEAGPLKLARLTEPLGLLVANLAYVQGMGTRITSVLMRDH